MGIYWVTRPQGGRFGQESVGAVFPLLRLVLLGMVAFSCAPLFAQTDTTRGAALNDDERAAVTREVDALVTTSVWNAERFVAHVASPPNVERLFGIPAALTKLSKTQRENALILAGRGPTTLLDFEKPSDVITKIAAWFPTEITAARARKRDFLKHDVYLHGPYENWTDEAIAFVVLWRCMPNGVWLRPELRPFGMRENDSLSQMPIAAKQSAQEEYDFAFCVSERNGPGWPRSAEERRANVEYAQRIAVRATPVLQRKFAWFLSQHRCRGTGPDDCALILLQWAKLAPRDIALAALLLDLERDIALGSALPRERVPHTTWADARADDARERFDEALRRSAFLRAKVLSILNAPELWPFDAIDVVEQQRSALHAVYAEPAATRFRQLHIGDEANTWINPSIVLTQERVFDARRRDGRR